MPDKPEFQEIYEAEHAHFICSNCGESFRFSINTTLGAIERERKLHQCAPIAFIGYTPNSGMPVEAPGGKC